jgi:hypothetical protein
MYGIVWFKSNSVVTVHVILGPRCPGHHCLNSVDAVASHRLHAFAGVVQGSHSQNQPYRKLLFSSGSTVCSLGLLRRLVLETLATGSARVSSQSTVSANSSIGLLFAFLLLRRHVPSEYVSGSSMLMPLR